MTILPEADYTKVPAPPDVNRLLWLIADAGIAGLTILLSTEALTRFGIASLLWMGVYALVLGRIFLNYRGFAAICYKNWPYFVYPAYCMLSVVWSALPSETVIASTQLIVTFLIAIWMGGRFRLEFLCFAYFSVIVFTVLLSLVNWKTGMFGNVYAESGGLLGIYSQKNQLGQRCLFAIISGLALFLGNPYPRWRGLIQIYVVALMPFILLALFLSKSATSIILSIPFVVGLAWGALLGRSRPQAIAVLVFGLMALAVFPLVFTIAGFDPVEATLKAFGKNSTLTGRTGLWEIAILTYDRYAPLGVGFSAFWKSPSFANLIYLAHSIGGETVTGFHNFILEILVSTGIPGLLTMLVLIVWTLSGTIKLWLYSRSTMAVFAALAVMMAVVLALVGPSLYRQHEFSIMLIISLDAASRQLLQRYLAPRDPVIGSDLT